MIIRVFRSRLRKISEPAIVVELETTASEIVGFEVNERESREGQPRRASSRLQTVRVHGSFAIGNWKMMFLSEKSIDHLENTASINIEIGDVFLVRINESHISHERLWMSLHCAAMTGMCIAD